VKRSMAAIALIGALSICRPASAGTVGLNNPGFETGDLTGWSASGNLSSFMVTNFDASAGSFGLNANQVGTLGFLSQIFATTPGTVYTVSFWLMDNGSSVPNDAIGQAGAATSTEFMAIVNGALQMDVVDSFPSPNPGVQSFQFTATGSSSTLSFGFRNDPASFSLDNVTITFPDAAGVPEPATTALIGAGLLALVIGRRRVGFRVK